MKKLNKMSNAVFTRFLTCKIILIQAKFSLLEMKFMGNEGKKSKQ